MKVQKIASKNRTAVKRVAAYARVSTMLECQEESFDTQVNYYESLIKNTPNWMFAKVYADHGFSGVSAAGRPGFMEMIKAAERGEFNIVLVRSISRFARNVIEAQEYSRKLRALGVEVRFEKEHISNFDASAEMAFNLLATCAQAESKSTSDRIKWTLKENAKMGIRHLGNNHVLGYDEIDGVLTPNEDAWIIRLIFDRYVNDVQLKDIVSELEELGVVGMRSKVPMQAGHILKLIRNEIYVGDRQLQKVPHKNYMTHKPDWSQPFDSYYYRDTHEGIIDRETWEKACRRGTVRDFPYRKDNHFLFHKLCCGKCGAYMKRRKTCGTGGMEVFVWKCAERMKGHDGNGCKNTIWKEEDLFDVLCEKLGVERSGLEDAVARIDRIVMDDEEITILPFAN